MIATKAPKQKKCATKPASAGSAMAKTPKPAAWTGVHSRLRGFFPLRGATFVRARYDSPFGTRFYDLYVPAVVRLFAGPPPLIVMMHGCGQTSRDFALGTGMNALADEYGFVVVYPSQSRSSQINGCWNWFKPSNQARGSGEPALIAGLTHHVMAQQKVDPARVYIAGLSAGASAAMIMTRAYPDIFAAVGVHSGLAAGAAYDAASATAAMQFGSLGHRHATRMPTIIFHGDADKVVNPRNGRFIATRALQSFENLTRNQSLGRIAEGRSFVRTTYRIGRGRSYVEHWVVNGSGHAWSGGDAAGRFTDPQGPDASREMVKFFLRHRKAAQKRAADRMIA